jgi:membrane-associated phospholipid phosphatase
VQRQGKPSYRSSDAITVIFCAFLIVVTAAFFPQIPSSGPLLLIYLSLIVFQVIIVRISTFNAVLSYTRDIIFPVIAVVILFDSLGLIVHAVNPRDIDYLLIQIDYRLFGLYPTVYMEKFVHPVLTDILQIAYSTYYFLPVTLGVVLKHGGKQEALERTLFTILLCFYLSYAGYLLFPALGPRYAMNHLHEEELGGFLFSEAIQNMLNLLEGVKRDAFPSGHTAIALVVLYLSFRYARTLFSILLLPVLLLIAATVYCRYHYVIDVIGGVILAVVTVICAEVYYTFTAIRMKTSPGDR